MRVTIRQYQPLAISPTSAEAWDIMRTTEVDTPFSIPRTREAWRAKALSNQEVQPRAAAIVQLARDLGAGVTSLGAGGAWLEFHISRLAPDLPLSISDYSPVSVARLRNVFPECGATQLDILRSPLEDNGALVLLHRVDTEFSDDDWRKIFSRMATAGIERILFVPSEILTAREAIWRVVGNLRSRIRGQGWRFCGWLRTRASFDSLWEGSYELERELGIGDLTGFLIRRRS